MKIQTTLFGWSVAILLCPAVLTGQLSSEANRTTQPVRAAQPVSNVSVNQEVIPAPPVPIIVPASEYSPATCTDQPAAVAPCQGGNHVCRSHSNTRCPQAREHSCRSASRLYATPFAASTRQILETQISKGSQAQMVFYNLHFLYRNGHWELSPAGYDHAKTVCGLMGNLPDSVNVLVESTGIAQVDEQKKQLIFKQLNSQGCPIRMQQLHTGKPSLGLSGPEALIIYQQRMGRIANPSLSGSVGGSSGSSFSGSSLSSGFSGTTR